MNELDEILLEQYYSAKKRKKTIKRLIKLMPLEKQLKDGEILVEKHIKFIESMIEDKQLLNKKYKKKKQKQNDLLAKNTFYDLYKNILYITYYNYKIFVNSAKNCVSYLKKNKIQ